MDMRKLLDMVMEEEAIQDIPVIYVMRVIYTIFAIINSGECFYDNEAEL